MAISVADNFKIQLRKQNVERDSFKTIEDMKAFPESGLPSIFTATCEETGKIYMYRRTNEILEDLGKWREYSTGGAPSDVSDRWVIGQ